MLNASFTVLEPQKMETFTTFRFGQDSGRLKLTSLHRVFHVILTANFSSGKLSGQDGNWPQSSPAHRQRSKEVRLYLILNNQWIYSPNFMPSLMRTG